MIVSVCFSKSARYIIEYYPTPQRLWRCPRRNWLLKRLSHHSSRLILISLCNVLSLTSTLISSCSVDVSSMMEITYSFRRARTVLKRHLTDFVVHWDILLQQFVFGSDVASCRVVTLSYGFYLSLTSTRKADRGCPTLSLSDLYDSLWGRIIKFNYWLFHQ